VEPLAGFGADQQKPVWRDQLRGLEYFLTNKLKYQSMNNVSGMIVRTITLTDYSSILLLVLCESLPSAQDKTGSSHGNNQDFVCSITAVQL
jgi:hypothetical protein